MASWVAGAPVVVLGLLLAVVTTRTRARHGDRGEDGDGGVVAAATRYMSGSRRPRAPGRGRGRSLAWRAAPVRRRRSARGRRKLGAVTLVVASLLHVATLACPWSDGVIAAAGARRRGRRLWKELGTASGSGAAWLGRGFARPTVARDEAPGRLWRRRCREEEGRAAAAAFIRER